MKDQRIPLRARILIVLAQHKSNPQTEMQLAAQIPGAPVSDIGRHCRWWRLQGKIGRSGKGTADQPFRYYLKAAP